MAPDIDMKPAKEEKAKPEDSKPAPPPPPPPAAQVKSNLVLIERGVATLEPRFTHRVLRTLTGLRKKINDSVLREVIEDVYATDASTKSALLAWLPGGHASMDVDPVPKPAASGPKQALELLPESEIYLRLLIIHHLLATPAGYPKAIELSNETVAKMQALNRRSMDPLAAKVWYALERAYELGGDLADARPLYLAAQRTASLRHDDDTLASLLNRLLRSYVRNALYAQADKLVSKTTFPASAGSPQYARYHYYLAHIRAVQLDYSAAHANVQQAIRRAPPATVAPGFYQAVHKLDVLVELLMGDIPERSLFRHPVLERALAGYFDVVKAVRSGSLAQFQGALTTHTAQFERDGLYALVVRLRQTVIKTGVRRLSLSYSRIGLRDICVKLNLDSEQDAEYIAGKAIRDGVIDGRLSHAHGWMECGAPKGGYGNEVAEVFGRRIGYCMELHNQSVKAMRYPLNAHRKELAAAEGAREREKELAKEIQQGDLDDDDGLGDF